MERSRPDKDWSPIIAKIQSQMLLRALSCIQIATKLHPVSDTIDTNNNNNHKTNNRNVRESIRTHVLGCADIQDELARLGYHFSAQSVMNSELRVLKYLDYRVSVATPFDFVELLLEILGRNVPDLNPTIFYLIGMKVLECFYCQRDKIYERLYESITGRSADRDADDFDDDDDDGDDGDGDEDTKKDDQNANLVGIAGRARASESDSRAMKRVESDYLYLAASIIVSAAHIYDNEDKLVYGVVLDAMATISRLDKCDLADLAAILCHFSLSPDEDVES